MDFGQLGRQINRSQRQREADASRVYEVQGGVQVVYGQFLTENPGESARVVNFPVKFVEKPLFFTGAELQGASIVDGKFPQYSITVIQYRIEKLDEERQYFEGANLAVRTSGPEGMKLWVNWMAVGVALGAPLSGEETSDSEV